MYPPAKADTTSEESTVDLHQSGLGVASLALSLVSIVATIGLVVYAGYIEVTTEDGVAANNATTIMIGLGVFVCIAMLLVGLILGVVGLLQKERRRTLAAIGVGLNGICAILIGVFFWLGSISN